MVCKNCGGDLKPKASIYCSNKCQMEWQRNEKIRLWEEEGKPPGHLVVRKYLEEKFPNCSECGVGTTWNGKPLVLEKEHIDGDSENNSIDNLTLLCPNCHSQTSTFKGRNIGNGRKKRREIYQAGVARLNAVVV